MKGPHETGKFWLCSRGLRLHPRLSPSLKVGAIFFFVSAHANTPTGIKKGAGNLEISGPLGDH